MTTQRLENNLSQIQKRLVIVIIIVVLLILSITIFLSLNRSEKVADEEIIPPPNLKLALLNGCGIDGVATEVKEYFINNTSGNIDIVSWRNVDRNLFIYNKSIIVVKKENDEKLKYLMEFTGIDRKIYAVDNNAIEDLQIILGNDYREFFK